MEFLTAQLQTHSQAANVVLTSMWQPKLIDCGLSKLLSPE